MNRYISIIILIFFLKPAFGQEVFKLSQNKELLLSGSAVLLSTAGAYFYLQAPPDNPIRIRENILPIDRSVAGTYRPGIARVSDAAFGLCLLMPLATLVKTHDEIPLSTQSVMFTEAMLGTMGLVLLAKGITERPRPFIYTSDLPEEKRKSRSAYRSFFSAHAALSFCSVCYAASVYQKSDPDSKWVAPFWCAGLSAASMTSVLRVMAGRHFPTDVLVGAAVGSVIGWGIPRLHEKQEKAGSYRITLAIPISS